MLSTCLLRIFKNCDVSPSLRTNSVFAEYPDSCVHGLNTQRPLKSPQMYLRHPRDAFTYREEKAENALLHALP